MSTLIEKIMSDRFKGVSGGILKKTSEATMGHGPEDFVRAGYDYMAWADMFFPDPSLPGSVKKAMHEAIDTGCSSHYGLEIGSIALRETFAEKVSQKMGLSIDPDRHVLVTAGSGPALMFSIMPFLSDGDEVLVPEPSYPNNYLNAKLLGASVIPVPLYEEDNYQLRIDEFEKRLSNRTKVVVLTNPNNPTGTVFRRKGIENLCEFVIRNDLVLVCDEAFRDTVYDGIEFVHPCTFPDMWERTITLYSISKGYGLSGLRIGCMVANENIMDVFYGAAVNVMGVPGTLTSVGAIAAMNDENILKENYERNERRRRIAYQILRDTPGVRMKMSESGLASWLDISQLGSADEVAAYLREKARIIVSPGTEYGEHGEGHLRIVTSCYRNDEDAIARFEQIKQTLSAMAKEKGLM
ncbi:MAG: pyridoxal phosphate-dependent aminotransferase [Synergistales bacterium]|nr:pyridoxal phosphate-dependent aminotransferase [Synergistales bacterium]